MNSSQLGQLGGIFAVLVFWHFFADWAFQSQEEAFAKAKNKKVRAWHCFKYAIMFAPLAFFVSPHAMIFSFLLLFVSHYVIDSYVPVMLWAKYLRKAPQFKVMVVDPNTRLVMGRRSDEESFKEFASQPLGLILMIVMDQFFHIACLLPVAYATLGPR